MMTNFFLDCEFVENGKTIDLISIGIISSDGKEFYAVNKDCDFSKASDWVKENVLKSIGIEILGNGKLHITCSIEEFGAIAMSKKDIADSILNFIGEEVPRFWGEWCSYDWVAFCQIFGTMMDLPDRFPMRCRDIIQWSEDHLGIPADSLPPSLEIDGNHSALLGARTVKARYDWLRKIDPESVMD